MRCPNRFHLQEPHTHPIAGFVQFATGNVSIDASVPSTNNIYVFNRTVLVATYLAAFGVLLVITAAGMFALIANGEPSANNFAALLAATRNPKLLPLAEAVKADPDLKGGAVKSARLMFGEVRMSNGRVEPGFGLAGDETVDVTRRRRFPTNE